MQESTSARNAISQDLFNRIAGYIPGLNSPDAHTPSAQKPWQRWIDAELGFRNHWYPVLPSRSVPEGSHKAIKVLGEELLFLRRGGKLHAIEDRCAHRGTRFSVRPLTFTNDTITCWHHTFTFNLADGRVRCLLNDPSSDMCGQKGIKSYPVHEVKGVVFVFIGDILPPPLECDVAPGFFDEDVAVCVAEPYIVKANWRLGAEGGFDPGHHFIHNWSTWSACAGLPMTFGWVPNKEVVVETNIYQADKLGQNGFTRLAAKSDVTSTSAWIPGNNGTADTEVVLPVARGFSSAQREAYEKSSYDGTVGGWMPGSLKVDWWPAPGIVHNEYYVPCDADSHYYFQCGWYRSSDPKKREEWANGELGQVCWKIPVVDQFTIDDAAAREATHEFYAREGGWQQERSAPFDIELLMWRTFCSDHARGVQRLEHTQGKFPR